MVLTWSLFILLGIVLLIIAGYVVDVISFVIDFPMTSIAMAFGLISGLSAILIFVL